MRPNKCTIPSVTLTLFAFFWGAASCFASDPTPPEDPARRLGLLLRKLDRTHRVLYVTAHPDDEDAGLLSYLSHGLGVETALMTLTRGEGGQNEIGPELFDALGVLRSRELQSARRYHGVRQFFSRAFEFGYSFSVEETYDKWGPERIQRDLVRVIREFRPQVLITMRSDGPGGGQHHQASARLAVAACELAARSQQWPELGEAHAIRRIFEHRGSVRDQGWLFISLIDVDPILGCSYRELGSRARGEHKCQGMVRREAPFPQRGAALKWMHDLGLEARSEPPGQLLEGIDEPLLDANGMETPFGATLRGLTRRARQRYRVDDPGALLPDLFAIWDHLEQHSISHPGLRRHTAEAITIASGVRIAARSARAWLTAGRPSDVNVVVDNRGPRPVQIQLEVRGPGLAPPPSWRGEIAAGERREETLALTVAAGTPPTVSRRVPRTPTSDEEGFTDPGWVSYRLGGTLFLSGRGFPVTEAPLEHVSVRRDFPELRRSDVHVVPDPSLRPRFEVLPLPTAPGVAPQGHLEYWVSSVDPGEIQVAVEVPEGWTLVPPSRSLLLTEGGVEVPVRFQIRGPVGATDEISVQGRARRVAGDRASSWIAHGFQVVDYPHIRRSALLSEARIHCVPFPCEVTARRVAYVAGTGDEMVRCLRLLGIDPVLLDRKALLEGDLDRFDVIVTGVRAYKVRDDLKASQPRLFEWLERGGTLVVQYNKLEFNGGDPKSPSPHAPWRGARVGRGRVTVEESEVRVLEPDHPVFVEPNRIMDADWRGWVQERGLYFLEPHDSRLRDLIELEDPWPDNAGPKRGALVEARVGEGRWIYAGLGFFRQLPAGVPGAYRLWANLMSLGNGEP